MDTKRCLRCQETKPVTEFSRNRWAFDDCQWWCKACFREFRRQHPVSPETRKRQREAAKRWNAENPERHRANAERWRKANPEKRREQQRRWREKNPERTRYLRRRSQIKRKYGLTVEEYDALIAMGCAICGSGHRVHMDHDHSNGKVRAALCENCNRGLGLFGDRPDRLRLAAKYLESHK